MLSPPKILLAPVPKAEFTEIANLESYVFANDNFCEVAFGPNRADEAATASRVKIFESVKSEEEVKDGEEWGRYVKATLHLDGEEGKNQGEVLVGWSGWNFYPKTIMAECTKTEGEKKAEDGGWGPDADVKFCDDVFIEGDKFMLEAVEGVAYAKLNTLVVDPKYQRRGIGSKLLTEGLKLVDERKLPCVLGASKEGRDLYKRFGFQDYHVMELNLELYERGKGLGDEQHVVMFRPAQTS